ncbi:MAG TPA: hypothetical protein VFN46_10160 [Acetobacteraceae bacterium]|nr:hypothetical protein [Acetobacteraceae bacterium]
MPRSTAHAPLSATLFEGRTMTDGETFYLVLALASFIGFAVVLAFHSWQQSRVSADFPVRAQATPQGTPQGAAQHA